MLDSYRFKLYRSFTFHLDSKRGHRAIRVPKGFITDFASVPKAFWSIIPPYGKYTKAAVLHDYLYHMKGFPKETWKSEIPYTRKECDRIFLQAMKVLGVSLVKRGIMYNAVRWFGAKKWNKK